jgi:hypothetical protein
MNDQRVLTDDLLRRALLQRMAHSPSPLLLERIVTGAAEATQERAARAWLRGRRRAGTDRAADRRWWLGLPRLAGAAAAVLIAVVIALTIRPVTNLPGGTPSPRPTPSDGASPAPTAQPVLLGDHQALRLRLGLDAAPIDVHYAFGSIWVANIRANDVRRFDPVTLDEIGRIPITEPSGPAWFVETADELWVTKQLGNGLTRIDPDTNTVVGQIGTGPTCGAPVLALASVWQSICDGGTFLRLDPVSRTVVESIPSQGHLFLATVGDRLITSTTEGLAELDPDTGAFMPLPGAIPGFRGLFSITGTSDGETVWVQTDAGVERIDPTDGSSLVTFPYTGARAVDFVDGRAWMSVELVGVLEIDLATNVVLQTIPVLQSSDIPIEAAGALYVTDFANSYLWRIEP